MDADIFQKCFDDRILKTAKALKRVGSYPYLIPFDKIDGSRVYLKNRPVIMIGSNNYLGLSFDPGVKEAAVKAIKKYGTSCSGSRFLNGTIRLHEEVEHKLARLQAIGRRMTAAFREAGFEIGDTETPIVPFVAGTRERAIRFWRAAFGRGVYTNVVLPPAVPPDRSLLRVSFMAVHTEAELARILDVLCREGRRLGLIGRKARVPAGERR
jgi:7-keto-8-aminopelargonate synthetase-like enzyme